MSCELLVGVFVLSRRSTSVRTVFVFVGTSDPYVKLAFGSKDVFKSKTVFKNLNPVWNERTCLFVYSLSEPLNVKVRVPTRIGQTFWVVGSQWVIKSDWPVPYEYLCNSGQWARLQSPMDHIGPVGHTLPMPGVESHCLTLLNIGQKSYLECILCFLLGVWS